MTAKVHPNFPDYEIREDGRVFRVRHAVHAGKGHIGRLGEMKGRVLASGYRQFKLCAVGGGQVSIRANRLVAETFHGPAPSASHHAAHNDGARLNNHKDNLRWDTPKGNNLDKHLHGTAQIGGNGSCAKLTDRQAAEIRLALRGASRGPERRAFAQKFGVSLSTIGRIVRGETYSEVGYSALERRA